MHIRDFARTSRSAHRYAGNLYTFFKGIIGSAPAHGIIVLVLRLAHKIFMVAGFVIGLKSISGRLDKFLGANFDLAMIPEIDHDLIMITVVAVLFAMGVAAQYLDLSLKSRISDKYGRFVQVQQIESIFDYAGKNNLTGNETAKLLAQYSTMYAVPSVRRLAAVSELMLLTGQGLVSAVAFLAIITVLSPAFGIILFSGTAIVVLYSIKKDYSRKIAVRRKHDRQESQVKHGITFGAQELESILLSKGLEAGRSQVLSAMNTKMLSRQLDTKKMKDSIKVLSSIMLSITVIGFLFFLSLGGIDINQVPWMLVILIYFSVRNAMNDIRITLRCTTSLNQHYEAITKFLDIQRRELDWPTELKSARNLEPVEDLSAEAI